jgi:uncharacterized protein YhhL (DUF1145 family)
MKAFMGIIWMLCGIGLTLHFASDNEMVRQVGHVLVVIALLWRLLLYLRETQPAAEHLHAVEQLQIPLLNLTAPALPSEQATLTPTADTHERDERSPIQRLFTDDK